MTHLPAPHFAFGSALAAFCLFGLVACGGGGDNSGGGGGGGGVASYTVTSSAGANGSIAPATPQTVNQGAATSFTIAPDHGYSIAAVSGCGGTLSGDTYTTGAITADCTVTASFQLDPAGIPALTLMPTTVKSFSFSWDDVSGETEYRLLENPDGSSGYTEVATIAADATSHDLEVFLPGRINASYILQACNSVGCSDSSEVFVSGTLADAVGYVKASNPGDYDEFGFALALSGDGSTLAVGAIYEESSAMGIDGAQGDNSASGSGAVYVFTRSGATWSQEAYVKASNPDVNDYFGSSVALAADGNTLAVGATSESSNATGIGGDQGNNLAPRSGAVYVFTRSGATWSQEAYVKASNTDMLDQFGWSVALSGDGDTLAVSAVGEGSNATGIGGDQDDNSAFESGAVYIFDRNGATWSQRAYVKASNAGTVDFERFGYSLALSGDGNTLAVGANGEASDATGIDGDQGNDDAPFSGAVYVFTRSGATWWQQAYVKASNTDARDTFGASVALSGDGNTLAVGAVFEDSNATGIGGDENNDEAINSGAAYVFARSGTTWSQQAYVKASNTEENDQFGFALALTGDGNTLAVGAWVEDSDATGINGAQDDDSASNSGATYVYTRSGESWSQQAYVKASNTDSSDRFGYSLALSDDGDTLAVGAKEEGSDATGVGGDQDNEDAPGSGAVYLY